MRGALTSNRRAWEQFATASKDFVYVEIYSSKTCAKQCILSIASNK